MTTNWSDLEADGVAPVVERIKQERDGLVLKGVGAIAPHLVGHHALGLALRDACDRVDIVVIEQNPDLGLFSRRRALLRLGLDEIGHRQHAGIDGFVESSVDPKWLRETHGANGDAPRGVPSDGGRQLWWRGAGERDGELRQLCRRSE